MKIKFIIALILCFSMYIVYTQDYSTQAFDVNDLIPHQINEWKGKDQTLSKSTLEMLKKNEILLRRYTDSNTEISVAVVLSKRRAQIHDPQVCYRGQGLSFMSNSFSKINGSLPVQCVMAHSKSGQKYQIYYWYTDFDNIYSKRSEFMKNVTISRLFGKNKSPYVALISIITPNVDTAEKDRIFLFAEDINNLLKEKISSDIKLSKT